MRQGRAQRRPHLRRVDKRRRAGRDGCGWRRDRGAGAVAGWRAAGDGRRGQPDLHADAGRHIGHGARRGIRGNGARHECGGPRGGSQHHARRDRRGRGDRRGQPDPGGRRRPDSGGDPRGTPTPGSEATAAPAEDAAEPADVVRYEVTEITIPTYPYSRHLSPATDPDVADYPLRVFDRAAYEASAPKPVPARYRLLVLENRYLRLEVLPDLGGRIYGLTFKPTGSEQMYRNPVIKPTAWGPARRLTRWCELVAGRGRTGVRLPGRGARLRVRHRLGV